MKKKSEFSIFNNAADSLEHGIRMYQDTNYPNAHKYAILAVYQAIELFLKDALCRINPVLIYNDIDKKIKDNSRTVGYKEAVVRLGKRNVHIDETAQANIVRLQKRRNRIEHHEYIPSPDDQLRMAEALKVLYDFVPRYLNSDDLANYIDDDLWDILQTCILDYNVLLSEAQKEIDQLTNVSPGDFLPDVVECPLCGNITLVISGKERGDYCYLCKRVVLMQQCTVCNKSYPPNYFEETTRCPDCYMAQFDAD